MDAEFQPQPEHKDPNEAIGETEKEAFKTKIIELMHNPQPPEEPDNASHTTYRKRDSNITVELFMPTTDEVLPDGGHHEGKYWVLVKTPFEIDPEESQDAAGTQWVKEDGITYEPSEDPDGNCIFHTRIIAVDTDGKELNEPVEDIPVKQRNFFKSTHAASINETSSGEQPEHSGQLVDDFTVTRRRYNQIMATLDSLTPEEEVIPPASPQAGE